MKKVVLEAYTDEMTGELGLAVQGMNTEDERLNSATEGLLLAHDIVEHVNGVENIGSIEDELQALGAIYYVRGQFDDLRRDGIGNRCVAENIASDLVRMFRDWVYNDESLNYFKTMGHDFDMEFHEAFKLFERDYAGEFDVEELNDPKLRVAQKSGLYLAAALANMRRGARKAAKKYGDAMRANTIFWNIAEAVEPFAKRCETPGQLFHLFYDDYRATCEEAYYDFE